MGRQGDKKSTGLEMSHTCTIRKQSQINDLTCAAGIWMNLTVELAVNVIGNIGKAYRQEHILGNIWQHLHVHIYVQIVTDQI